MLHELGVGTRNCDVKGTKILFFLDHRKREKDGVPLKIFLPIFCFTFFHTIHCYSFLFCRESFISAAYS